MGRAALGWPGHGAETRAVVWRLALVGAGQGLFPAPNTGALLSSVPPARLGTASGLRAVARNPGIASGIALAGSLVAARGGALTDASLLGGFGFALRVAAALALAALVVSATRPAATVRPAGRLPPRATAAGPAHRAGPGG